MGPASPIHPEREKPRESSGRSLSPLGALSATRPGKRAPSQVAIRRGRSLSFPDPGEPVSVSGKVRNPTSPVKPYRVLVFAA
jgi:hypothetical protein